MAPALEPLPLVDGKRAQGEGRGRGSRGGLWEGGAPGAWKVKSEQAFRDKISHFPCLHLPPKCREKAPLLLVLRGGRMGVGGDVPVGEGMASLSSGSSR